MEPTPPQDPNSEQSTSVEPESMADIVTENITKFIEGEPMGSTKSKAFCDAIDMKVLERKVHRLSGDSLRVAELELANLTETVRQRENELPGYSKAYTQIYDPDAYSGPDMNLSRAMYPVGWRRSNDEAQKISDALLEIKYSYLESARKQALSAPAVNSSETRSFASSNPSPEAPPSLTPPSPNPETPPSY